MTPEREAELAQSAFEMFADTYPHEAAEQDWPRFVAYTNQRAGCIVPEEKIREFLGATGVVEGLDK